MGFVVSRLRPLCVVGGMALASAGRAHAADDVLVHYEDGSFDADDLDTLVEKLQDAGAVNVDVTDAWPSSLASYRLVFLFPGRNGVTNPTGRAASLHTFLEGDGVLVVVGDNPLFMADDTELNGLLGSVGGSMRLWSAVYDPGCARVGTVVDPASPLLRGVASVGYGTSSGIALHGGSELLLGESGQGLLAVEGRILLASDADLFSDSCTLPDGNWTLVANLFASVPDFDGDGVDAVSYGGDDCDDGDAGAFPGGAEVCDGVDNDCDGATDPDDALDAPTWYADTDGDGFGAAAETAIACEPPAGFVATDTDCDDAEPTVSPDAEEWCDGVDDDCDGTTDEADAHGVSTWYADADGDGYGDVGARVLACAMPAGTVPDHTDCDDTAAGVNPAALEVCDGVVDEDCDGTVDEDDASDATAWYADQDHDGYGESGDVAWSCTSPHDRVADASDCDDTSARVSPAESERCDGVDDDCDGATDEDDALDASVWYLDADGDGFGDATDALVACDADPDRVAEAADCDDSDADVYPGADEVPYDGRDDDCDGADLCDADGDGWDALACAGADCDDATAGTFPDAPDAFYDGVDADCAGDSDYDRDGDGQDAVAFGGEDCDDGDAAVYAGAPDTPYDGIVNDCDSSDEYDTDGDGYRAEGGGGSDCDDDDPAVNPGEGETWYDGVDQDCDGASDDDADGDGYDASALGGSDCDDANPRVHPGASPARDGTSRDCTAEGDDGGSSGCAVASKANLLALPAGLLLVATRRRRPRSVAPLFGAPRPSSPAFRRAAVGSSAFARSVASERAATPPRARRAERLRLRRTPLRTTTLPTPARLLRLRLPRAILHGFPGAPVARLLLPAVLFAACAPSEEEALCEHKALHDADGSIDGCDFDACVACEESCDDSCITLEMTGSNYQCTTGESWSAVDFCPRWAAQ